MSLVLIIYDYFPGAFRLPCDDRALHLWRYVAMPHRDIHDILPLCALFRCRIFAS
jgi:hypothetical protein